jgi:hypothetical protein
MAERHTWNVWATPRWDRTEALGDEGRFVSPLRGSTGFQRHGRRGSVGLRPRLRLCQRYALQIGGVCQEDIDGLARLMSRCVRWEPHSKSADHFALWRHGREGAWRSFGKVMEW